MIVRVRLFAVARELAGVEEVLVELAAGSTVGQLRDALAHQVPSLAAVLRHVAFAINSQYAADAAQIPADAEVACIPPVSGG